MRRFYRAAIWLAATCFACAQINAAAGAQFTLDDIYTEVRLSSPRISPDGKHVLLTVAHSNAAENRTDESIVIVDVQTGEQRDLVGAGTSEATDAPNGDLGETDTKGSAATWSPNGERVAWLTVKQGRVLPQITMWSVHSPQQKPVVVPIGIAGASTFVWSPDGKWFAFLAPAPPHDLTGEARFDRSFEVFDIGQSAFVTAGFAPETHIWLVPTDGGSARPLTADDEDVRDIAWRADGRSIVYHSEPNSSQTASRSAALKSVDISTGQKEVLVPAPARILNNLRVSDKDGVAYRHFNGADPWTHEAQISFIRDGVPDEFTLAFDHDITQFEWMPGGNAVLATAPDHTQNGLWILTPDRKPQRIDLGHTNVLDMSSSAAGTIAFVGDDPVRPQELYILALGRAKPRRLTHFNDYLASLEQGRIETVTWHTDGFENNGILTYPPGYVAGRKYPLLVGIHGGPEASNIESFNAQSQFLAAQGWLVLQPNYRGSNNMGDKYEAAVINDPSDGASRDIMGGIEAVKAKGLVDENRVAVTGYSYGGVMTVALITQHKFCAAIPREFVTDWTEYYNLSESAIWLDEILGSPWNPANREKYKSTSFVSLIPKVKTPTLMLQNTGDPNAEPTDAYTFFHGLKENGVKTRLIMFGAIGHGADISRRRADLRYILEWTGENCR
jgi:dipeptidyl aminopeptidase/acylaminoacyl peptidase